MFKDTVTYVDFDGNTRTETLYFNLTKAEVIAMENSVHGGLSRRLQKIVDALDNVQIMDSFIDLIKASYGEKSDDGKRFIKNSELTEAFMQTGAYDEFFMKLISDEEFAADFIKGIAPADISDVEIANARKGLSNGDVSVVTVD